MQSLNHYRGRAIGKMAESNGKISPPGKTANPASPSAAATAADLTRRKSQSSTSGKASLSPAAAKNGTVAKADSPPGNKMGPRTPSAKSITTPNNLRCTPSALGKATKDEAMVAKAETNGHAEETKSCVAKQVPKMFANGEAEVKEEQPPAGVENGKLESCDLTNSHDKLPEISCVEAKEPACVNGELKENGEHADGNGATDSSSKGSDSSAETMKVVETKISSPPAELIEAVANAESKQAIRLKVWDHLESHNLVFFPRPCKGRIPNFKGAYDAAEKLIQQDFFINSKTIKVNPDKPQERIRFYVMERGKRLLVPLPRLRNGLFRAVVPPLDADKFLLRQAAQRFGMMKFGRLLNADDKMTVDLMVLGSVVVDKKGHRIGKGEGYSDLDFAILMKMGAITEKTIIVTTVHDDQVFDELPDCLFKEFDIPVDWIITPTRVIEVENKLKRPDGIIWSFLSNRRILETPALQTIREQEIAEGHECAIKEVDSEPEDQAEQTDGDLGLQRYPRRRFTRFRRYNFHSTGDPVRDNKMFQQGGGYFPRGRWYHYPRRARYDYDPYDRRFPTGQEENGSGPQAGPASSKTAAPPADKKSRKSRSRKKTKSTESESGRKGSGAAATDSGQETTTSGNEGGGNGNGKKKSASWRYKRNKHPIDFSLRVANIAHSARIRDLKMALLERGVKPRDITWRGYRGFAFLHFVKLGKKDEQPVALEDVVKMLQGITLAAENHPDDAPTPLIVEPAKPKEPKTVLATATA